MTPGEKLLSIAEIPTGTPRELLLSVIRGTVLVGKEINLDILKTDVEKTDTMLYEDHVLSLDSVSNEDINLDIEESNVSVLDINANLNKLTMEI
tara:strand:- start:998 stop:1279 length:282 start_codon:yes stop_codon:yes gene_type:complete